MTTYFVCCSTKKGCFFFFGGGGVVVFLFPPMSSLGYSVECGYLLFDVKLVALMMVAFAHCTFGKKKRKFYL